MPKYLDQLHNKRGMPSEYRNRVDLDTALKERGMSGLYRCNKKAEEQKELHAFVIKKANEKGEDRVKKQHIKGRLFNKKDSEKL